MVRDYGFAPNPFEGFCTLATCKPNIRRAAVAGDLVCACGSVANGYHGRIICAFRVAGKMNFQDYWEDPRFRRKRPLLRSSLRRAYGDNIYHHDCNGRWVQEDSHHSLVGGAPNQLNLVQDTQADHVLWSDDFVYWGRSAREPPAAFEGFKLDGVRSGRSLYAPEFVEAVDGWFRSVEERGRVGEPIDWG